MKIYITYRNENEKIIKRNAPPPSHSTTFSLSLIQTIFIHIISTNANNIR